MTRPGVYDPRLSRLKGSTMTAFNTVRFNVKPGRDQDFLDAPTRPSNETGRACGTPT